MRRASLCHCVAYPGWLFVFVFLPASRVVRRTSLGLAVQQTDFLSLRRASCVAASLILAGCLISFFSPASRVVRRTSLGLADQLMTF